MVTKQDILINLDFSETFRDTAAPFNLKLRVLRNHEVVGVVPPPQVSDMGTKHLQLIFKVFKIRKIDIYPLLISLLKFHSTRFKDLEKEFLKMVHRTAWSLVGKINQN